MADVFLSYSRRDFAFARRLADALEARGKEVWIDIEGIRDAEIFPAALRSAIETSDGFVFVISPDAVQSEYCVQEVDHAVETGKRIVPVEFRTVPDGEVPEPIRVRNWIPVDGAGDFESGVDRVLGALDTDLDHVKAHTRWNIKALEWESEGRDRSFLLRGAERSAAEAWLAGAADKEPEATALQREYLLASGEAAARRQRAVAAISLGVAIVSLALLVFALVQRGHALTQRSEARSARTTNKSRALAFESQNQQAVDPERAVLIAMEGVRAKATPDALFALRAALDHDPLQGRMPGTGIQRCNQLGPAVVYAPRRPWVIEGLCDGTVRVVDSRSERVVRTLRLRGPADAAALQPGWVAAGDRRWGRGVALRRPDAHAAPAPPDAGPTRAHRPELRCRAGRGDEPGGCGPELGDACGRPRADGAGCSARVPHSTAGRTSEASPSSTAGTRSSSATLIGPPPSWSSAAAAPNASSRARRGRRTWR